MTPQRPRDDAVQEGRRPQGGSSLLRVFRTVAWSFFGVRRSSGHEDDMQRLRPQHVIVAGLVAAALFVALLMVLVRWVVGSGVAA